MSAVTDFKARVAAYVGRDPGSFVTNGVDMLLGAINDARVRAQRDYNFQLLSGQVFIQTSAKGANFLTDCVTTPGGVTPARIKRIEHVWEYETTTISATTVYLPLRKYDFGTLDAFKRNLPFATPNDRTNFSRVQNEIGAGFAYTRGQYLYLPAVTEPTWLMLDVVKWLSPLDVNSSTDFFIEYASDWLLFASVQSLNALLKEDQRVAISQALLSSAWESVKDFDAQISVSTDAINLD